MKKLFANFLVPAAIVASLCGCASIANHILDAMEPRLEQIADYQIEREEKLQGIWGTTNSYFYARRQLEEEELRKQVDDAISIYRDELMKQIDKIISERFAK